MTLTSQSYQFFTRLEDFMSVWKEPLQKLSGDRIIEISVGLKKLRCLLIYHQGFCLFMLSLKDI